MALDNNRVGRGKAEGKRANIELISETDYKQLRTATLWPMRRHGANGKGGLAMRKIVFALFVAMALVLLLASAVR